MYSVGRSMQNRWVATLSMVSLAAVVVLAVGCGGSAAGVATTAKAGAGPFTHSFPWGKFTLSSDIATKVRNKQQLNVVLSIVGMSTPVYSPEFKQGFASGVKSAQATYGVKLKGHLIGPVQADANEQISQIRSQLATKQVDCLVIEAGGLPAFAPVINQAVAAGVPVFTTNTDVARSHRFSTFHTNWQQEGQLAARATAAFFKKKGIALKEVVMTTGQVDQNWAQARMDGFMTKLKKLVPGVKFDNTPKTALSTGYDASAAYSQIRAFLQGHPGVQAVYQTDINADAAVKAIAAVKRQGKAFVIGHNVSLPTLDAIKSGSQIGTLDQQFPVQAGWAAQACAAYLGKGKVLPNANKPLLITAANVVKARAEFIRLTK
jgi:ABC-type sugar transport system substrate-binding protein